MFQELLKLTEKHGSGLRCVLFVQQRLTTHILEHALSTSASSRVRGLKTDCVYATTSPASPKLRVTKQQAADRVAAFASGQVSVLLATSVAEVGMDVPAANCVFDLTRCRLQCRWCRAGEEHGKKTLRSCC